MGQMQYQSQAWGDGQLDGGSQDKVAKINYCYSWICSFLYEEKLLPGADH